MRRRFLLHAVLVAPLLPAARPAFAAAVSPLELAGPIAQYKLYVLDEARQLVERTERFTTAVKAGELARAQALYAATREPYERIEPLAELFSDLDGAIDSRADDHAKAEQDPDFTGFHRIEYGLFHEKSTDGLAPFADKLLADVRELHTRLQDLTTPPDKVVGGAAALIEEVAATKISGEENRYSGTDLSDFQANIDGSKKIVDVLRPLLQRADAALLAQVDGNFGRVNAILARYRTADGFQNYEKLSAADRNGLQAPITALAEDLSRLRGTLGLD
ncbi:iron uptake system protein EfeO [Roseomonas aerophila]|uniref:Iron uptake system protein EfeO n=1 Tax=Teichococcus aerophilus TaxID=1224513 RepID=A0ABR7RIQ4_9PROT|nr:iron uptake system protein EfeO [Pseudoroseomonas aerophila]MBC9206459.1 iron uptake system protein EfeO [Pseudoroseomonas aerophila]